MTMVSIKVFSTPILRAGRYDSWVASEKASGAAIPSSPIVMIGSGISCWIKLMTGDTEETAVLRLKAISAMAAIAKNFFN